MSTVSSEFEINTVEKLIDDLCNKLREVEKEDEIDNDCLKEATNLTNKPDQADPTKRYYNAFPALSKDMEDSVRILRNNCKSLTWPKTSQKQQQQQFEKLNNRQHEIKPVSSKIEKAHLSPNFNSVSTTGVKRKPKRRRNQAINRNSNKTSPEQVNLISHRKSYSDGNSEVKGGGIVNSKVSVTERNCSSPTWDTDFEGSWEMGRDLIKEFLMKENNRNRSTSESAVSGLRENIYQEMEENDNFSNNVSTPTSTSSNTHNLHVDSEHFEIVSQYNPFDCNEQEQQSSTFTVFSDEGYSTHENLTMLSDIASGDVQNYVNPSRRLYERDISNDSISSPISDAEEVYQNPETDLDFAQFKAKFDSNVEALWKGSDVVDSISNSQIQRFWNEGQEIDGNIVYEEKNYFSMPPSQNSLYHNSLQPSLWQNNSIWSVNEDVIDSKHKSGSMNFFHNDKIGKVEQKLLNNFPLDQISYKWSEGINGVSTSHFNNTPQTTQINSLINYESTTCVLQKTTLTNHSVTKSAFTEYSLIKPKMGALLPRTQYTPKDKDGSRTRSLPSADDNLINSADTYFTPIKQNYANGYTFSINSDVDDVDYIFSEDGYLLLDNQKYLEYKSPKDDVLDSQSTSSRSFTPSIESVLNVKFKLKSTEIACQTEEEKLPDMTLLSSCTQWPGTEICKNCTLWGNCLKCCQQNMVTVPIPANRLLKDELSIEGDEIMANLKYLYIGTNTASWMDIPSSSETSEYDDNDDMLMQSVTPVNDEFEIDSVANEVYKNVTKLISDLLQPVSDDDSDYNDGGGNDKDLVEGIEVEDGGDGGSDHIWTQNLSKIWDNGGNENSSINWEYSNLAEIWNKDFEKKSDISQRLQSFLENATCVSGKNRKRRHSASQKIYNNNNNNEVNCNNNMMMKMMMLPPDQQLQQQSQTIITCKYWTRKLDSTTDNSLNQQKQFQLNNNNDNINNLNSYNNNDENFSRNKIFIECTKDPLESSAIASALKLKLQHISRPLTR